MEYGTTSVLCHRGNGVAGDRRVSGILRRSGRGTNFPEAAVQIPRLYSNRLALTVDGPDAPGPAAPKPTWVHWVLHGVAPNASGLATAGAASERQGGTQEGLNDWKRTGYGGPFPSIGRRHYVHKRYARDTPAARSRQTDESVVGEGDGRPRVRESGVDRNLSERQMNRRSCARLIPNHREHGPLDNGVSERREQVMPGMPSARG